jgi:hypothetical protein
VTWSVRNRGKSDVSEGHVAVATPTTRPVTGDGAMGFHFGAGGNDPCTGSGNDFSEPASCIEPS